MSKSEGFEKFNAGSAIAAGPATTRKRRLIIAVGLLLIMTLGYGDRVNFSIAAPHILKEFGLTNGQFGLLSSSFNWSYLLLLIPVGIFADRAGTRALLPLSIIVWSIAAGLTGFAVGLVSLLSTRLLMGIGESPVYPGGNLVIREWAPAGERGFFAGMLNTGALVGPAIGSVVAAYLINAFGWRDSFLFLGGFGIAVGVFWYVIYEKPEKTKWLSEEERAYIVKARETVFDTAKISRVESMTIGKLLRAKSLWGLVITQGCAVYTNYLFLSFLPLYLVNVRGMKDMGAGWTTGVTYAVAAIGSIAVVALSDQLLRSKERRLGISLRRKSLIVVQLLALPLLILPWVSGTALIVGVVSWVLIFDFAATSLNWALASDLVVDKDSAGRVYALVTVGGNALGLISPIVTGYLIDATQSYSLPFVIAGVLMLIGAVATYFLSRTPLQSVASI